MFDFILLVLLSPISGVLVYVKIFANGSELYPKFGS
jgi:hypothetical protein